MNNYIINILVFFVFLMGIIIVKFEKKPFVTENYSSNEQFLKNGWNPPTDGKLLNGFCKKLIDIEEEAYSSARAKASSIKFDRYSNFFLKINTVVLEEPNFRNGTMEILFKISSNDEKFSDFYQQLAWKLEGHGTVYTPHFLIPHNARMAIPSPSEVIVSLHSIHGFKIVYNYMQEYINHNTELELTLLNGDNTIIVAHDKLPERKSLLKKLFPLLK